MITALFNPPKPKHWIYIAIIIMALFIISILNSCKSRKLEKESSKLIDKTEQVSKVIKKDSANNVLNKTEKINTTKESVKIDTGSVITEKTKTTIFDSIGKVKSIFETVKITDHKKRTNTSNVRDLRMVNTNDVKVKTNHLDSTGTKKNDIIKEDQTKHLDAKKESSIGWVIFGVVLVLVAGFAVWKFK